MPELPEVEITARRIGAAVAGVGVESAVAPGINALKTFDPPLDALAGRSLVAVRRRGKHLIVDAEDGLSLLVHLMSAGRLQLFDKRAGPKDRTSRLLVRLEGGGELRLRDATISCLGGAIDHYEEVVKLPIPDKLPMPLNVHRRQGEPCPRCGTTLEAVHYEDYVMSYCPTDQTEGRILKDRRLSRLLK